MNAPISPTRRKPMPALGALALLIAGLVMPRPAAADQTATLRGVIFDCDTHRPLAGIPILLTSSADSIVVRSDERGRFSRLGMTPGAWTIATMAAFAPIARNGIHQANVVRYATVQPGDVIDVPIGIFHNSLEHVDAKCQQPRVPRAESPNLRYTLQ